MAQRKAIAKRLLKKNESRRVTRFFRPGTRLTRSNERTRPSNAFRGRGMGGGDILNFGIFVLRPGVVDWRRARDARFQARTAASVGRGRSADVGAPADAGRILAGTSRGCPVLFFFFFVFLFAIIRLEKLIFSSLTSRCVSHIDELLNVNELAAVPIKIKRF